MQAPTLSAACVSMGQAVSAPASGSQGKPATTAKSHSREYHVAARPVMNIRAVRCRR